MSGSRARSRSFSASKATPAQAYNIFLSTLEVQRQAAVPKGDVIQIIQTSQVPPERTHVYVYKLKHALATDTTAC